MLLPYTNNEQMSGVETMLTGQIIVRAATAEDIPFMRAMIWEAMLASPTFLAMHGVENLQQLEED